jgi:Arm DNA-binding domain
MAGKLRPLDVERETRPGKYFDGDGLYLVVKGATSRNWIYRYRKDGKERWLGLGSLKDVSLKDARLARDARLRVKGDHSTPGVDIVQEERAAREEAKATEIKVTLPIFEECEETYVRELAHWLLLASGMPCAPLHGPLYGPMSVELLCARNNDGSFQLPEPSPEEKARRERIRRGD